MKSVNKARWSGCLPVLCAAGFVLFATTGMGAAENQAPQTGGKAVAEPLKIVKMVEPVYPLGLMINGVTKGSVDVIFGVDAEGRLDDYLVTAYTKREFVREVETALKQWRFDPMRVDGVPIWSLARLNFSFEAKGAVITRYALDGVTMLAGSMLEDSNRVQVVSRPGDLDHPLKVARAVAPLYPAQLAESKQAGVVRMEFFVDEAGRVRLPVMEGDGHSWFGEAAAQALMQWTFEPPVKNGHPTVVKARQQFVFNP